MRFLKRAFSRVVHAGVHAGLPPDLARRILTTNRISFTIFWVTCPYVAIFHAAGAHLYGDIVIYIAGAYLAFIAMNAYGFYRLSRLAMLTHFNAAVFTYSSIFGQAAGIHLCYFVLICLPLTIYEIDDRRSIAFGMLLPVAGFVLLEVTGFDVLPTFALEQHHLNLVYWAISLSNFVMLGAAVLFAYHASGAAERLLRDEKALNELTLQTTTALIAVVGLDGKLVRFNRACERLTGYASSELEGTDHSLVLVPAEHKPALKAARDRLARGEEGVRMLNQWRSREGRLRWIDWVGAPLRDAKGRVLHFLVTGIDITERVEAERVVGEQQAKLLTAAKMSALGEMSSGIAHEVNNPLAVIQLKADQLLASPGRADVEAIARKIDAMVDRISKIVQSLRGFAREASQDPFQPVRVDALCEDVLTFCRERFRNHGIELRSRIPAAPLEFQGRGVEVSQALLNLMNNSFDAVMELEQGRWVELAAEDTGDTVVLSVSDGGPGITRETRQRLFEPFFTTKPVGKGTGLGLSISRAIVESHRGTLSLDESCPNTRFRIAIPKSQS